MQEFLDQPAIGIALTLLAYIFGVYCKNKCKTPLANPLAIAGAIIILLITKTPLTMKHYQTGGAFITMFILPATTVLALHIHRQWSLFGKNLKPVLIGCLVGSVSSIASVALMCKLLGLDRVLMVSLQPKSVTTAIALELSLNSGGLGPITVAAVILTGVAGVIIAPCLIKILHLDGSVEIGVALGTSAHAIGTSTALEIGEIEGAMSGIALVLSGVITSILYLCFM